MTLSGFHCVIISDKMRISFIFLLFFTSTPLSFQMCFNYFGRHFRDQMELVIWERTSKLRVERWRIGRMVAKKSFQLFSREREREREKKRGKKLETKISNLVLSSLLRMWRILFKFSHSQENKLFLFYFSPLWVKIEHRWMLIKIMELRILRFVCCRNSHDFRSFAT